MYSLNLPILIIRGEGDPYLSADICEKLHENIIGSKLVKFVYASHFMMEEIPEEITKEIIGFFGEN